MYLATLISITAMNPAVYLPIFNKNNYFDSSETYMRMLLVSENGAFITESDG